MVKSYFDAEWMNDFIQQNKKQKLGTPMCYNFESKTKQNKDNLFTNVPANVYYWF